MKIKSGRFVTQIEYRNGDDTRILGWIGDFEDGGTTSKRGYLKTYKSTANGKRWSKKWTSHDGAIQQLLIHHGIDTLFGAYYVIPCAQTFSKLWKPLPKR